MPSKNPAQRLKDIVDNIDAIRAFTSGMAHDDFAADRKTIYAVTRALEIISEASRRLPDDLKLRHPAIDWPAMAAAGNIYRHEYEVVDEALVWHTVQNSLTGLRDLSIAELRRLTAK
ncbi:MAG: HepT-like ribonuclease domain-containing protein [Bryobacteraceae bacterium]